MTIKFFLDKACFDFIRLIGAVMDFDIIPFEKLIQSMAIILGEDEYGLPTFRYPDVKFFTYLFLVLISHYSLGYSILVSVLINMYILLSSKLEQRRENTEKKEK